MSATQKFAETINDVIVDPGKASIGLLRIKFDHVIGDFHLATPTVNYILQNVDWLFPTPVSTLRFMQVDLDCK